MQPITYGFLLFVVVLFLVVRQFLRKWGLGGSPNGGDYGMGRFFYYVAFFLMWVLPCAVIWCVVDIVRHW